ncbi:hypothetical protein ElyMa_001238500, partial [Elysia marginata]
QCLGHTVQDASRGGHGTLRSAYRPARCELDLTQQKVEKPNAIDVTACCHLCAAPGLTGIHAVARDCAYRATEPEVGLYKRLKERQEDRGAFGSDVTGTITDVRARGGPGDREHCSDHQ